VTINRDIPRHDIVLLSRVVHVPLSEMLRKINLAAKSACYVTWRAERHDEFETEVAEVIGRSHPFYPDYSLIYSALRHCGISAGIDTFETETREIYSFLREALLSTLASWRTEKKRKSKECLSSPVVGGGNRRLRTSSQRSLPVAL